MRNFRLNVRKEPTEHDFMPTMDVLLLDGDDQRPMVIVVPGGGYVTVCDDEKTMMQYSAAGFHTAILNYSVVPHLFPEALIDLAGAVRLIREHAEEWHVSHVILCGFSAGGHLCASLATLWNNEELLGDTKGLRPDGCILLSAVLTKKLDHCRDFLDALAGREEYKDLVACDEMVSDETPPAFLYGTYEDQLGNYENSLYYAEALGRHKIPFELHIFPKGEHGAPWCDETIWSLPHNSGRNYHMIDLSIEWLNEIFIKK